MNRNPIVIGNWKMELSHKAELEVVRSLKNMLKSPLEGVEIVICPSFPSLSLIAHELGKSDKIQVGAQNVHWEEKGPFTGQVSVGQILPFARWCIIGHSEQRELTGETDELVELKANLLLKYGITPIICIGETGQERHDEQTVDKITYQVGSLLKKLTRTAFSKIIIAYEPIWAIGTGVTPDSNEVAGTMMLIRKLIADRFDEQTAQRVRLVYGGSVTTDTIASFMAEPGIDGALVGGASIHPFEFLEIAKQIAGR
jgi:triosephosphate isomerase